MRSLSKNFALLLDTATQSSTHHIINSNGLQVDIYHNPQVPVTYQDASLLWPPTAFTLIHISHEAALIDAPPVYQDGQLLASWIASKIPCKKLKYIYITHAHVDHFNSFPAILQRYPEVEIFTTKKVLRRLPGQIERPTWDLWTNTRRLDHRR